MSELESAEQFVDKIAREARVDRPWGHEWVERNVVALIEARDNAVRLAAKRELLAELQTALDVHHALTGHDSLLCYVRAHLDIAAKYQTKEESDG